MRQFLAVTVLLAMVALPAAYFLNGAPPPAAHNVRNLDVDHLATASILAGLQRVGVGLAASLGGGSDGAAHPSAIVPAERAAEARASELARNASLSAEIGGGAPSPAPVAPPADRYRGIAGAAGRSTAIAFAAAGGHGWLTRDYPTAFLWFVLG
jgi:hypothetical protein